MLVLTFFFASPFCLAQQGGVLSAHPVTLAASFWGMCSEARVQSQRDTHLSKNDRGEGLEGHIAALGAA